jgi:hypothetical protein
MPIIMKIDLGGRLLDRPLGPNPPTLNELVKLLQSELIERSLLIMDISIDGHQLSPAEYESQSEQQLTDDQQLKLDLVPFATYCAENLQQAHSFHEALQNQLANPQDLEQTIIALRSWCDYWRTWVLHYPQLTNQIALENESLTLWLHRGRRAFGELIVAHRENLPSAHLIQELRPIVAHTRQALTPLSESVRAAPAPVEDFLKAR